MLESTARIREALPLHEEAVLIMRKQPPGSEYDLGLRINNWGMAAGSLLVVEAGGLVTDIHGEDGFLYGGSIIAAAPKILPQMMQTLSPHMKKALTSAKPGVSREA